MRAKFYVNTITTYAGYVGVKVELSPVMNDSQENKKFWKATPNGKLELSITHPDAAKYFEVGKEYYLDFTEVVI